MSSFRGLSDARQSPDAVMVIQADSGGAILVTCPVKYVQAREDVLTQLVADLEAIAWGFGRLSRKDVPKHAVVYYAPLAVGSDVAGGTGGGRVVDGVWVHVEIERLGLRRQIEDVVAGVRDRLGPEDGVSLRMRLKLAGPRPKRDLIAEAEAGYQEALAAVEADDLMRARAATTAAIHLAGTASGWKEVGTLPRLREVFRRIGDLERQSEPLVVGQHLERLLAACESFCVAACCGTGAFDPECTKPWLEDYGREAGLAALAELDSLLAFLASREAEGHARVLWSGLFEEALTAGAWRRFLASWRPLLDPEAG